MTDDLVWALAFIVVIVVAAFVWTLGRSAYFWIAARINGWDENEKFERETRWLDRAVERDKRQAERDLAAAGNLERRRMGITFVTVAMFIVAYEAGLAWWLLTVVAILAFFGLHMISGLSIRWRE